MKKSRKRIVWIVLIVIVVAAVAMMVAGSKGKPQAERRTVKVERKDIVEKALAVGSIEPLNEIAVKSKVSGVVGKLFVDVGDFVKKGDPILEVKPDPTPQELVQAKRNVEMRQIGLETLQRELERNEELRKKNLISDYDLEQLRQSYDEAELNHRIAVEQLELLESGKVTIANKSIETVIKSPHHGIHFGKDRQRGRPRGAPDLVPGRHRTHEDGRHAAADLQGHGG